MVRSLTPPNDANVEVLAIDVHAVDQPDRRTARDRGRSVILVDRPPCPTVDPGFVPRVPCADGSTLAFSSNALDPFGSPLVPRPTFEWSVVGLGRRHVRLDVQLQPDLR